MRSKAEVLQRMRKMQDSYQVMEVLGDKVGMELFACLYDELHWVLNIDDGEIHEAELAEDE